MEFIEYWITDPPATCRPVLRRAGDTGLISRSTQRKCCIVGRWDTEEMIFNHFLCRRNYLFAIDIIFKSFSVRPPDGIIGTGSENNSVFPARRSKGLHVVTGGQNLWWRLAGGSVIQYSLWFNFLVIQDSLQNYIVFLILFNIFAGSMSLNRKW